MRRMMDDGSAAAIVSAVQATLPACRRIQTSASSPSCTARRPKAVWLRIGNASTLDIFNVLRDHLDDVTRFAATEDEALLVLPAT